MNHTNTYQTLAPARPALSLTRTILRFISLLTIFALLGAVASTEAQTALHRHGKRLPNDMLAEMQEAVKLVEAQPDAKSKRTHIARNASHTYEAFTLEVPIDSDANNVRETIFVEDKREGKLYEVRGFDFPRPFADLIWSGNDTLVFDQWMQPRKGVHYAVNVRQGKLTAAASF
jgi:hypothetical protein